MEPSSLLISWVNLFPSRFINRAIFFCKALESHVCACCLLSFLYFHWLFPLSARETPIGNLSIYKSTRERIDCKGLYRRCRLHLLGSWPTSNFTTTFLLLLPHCGAFSRPLGLGFHLCSQWLLISSSLIPYQQLLVFNTTLIAPGSSTVDKGVVSWCYGKLSPNDSQQWVLSDSASDRTTPLLKFFSHAHLPSTDYQLPHPSNVIYIYT